MSHTSLQGHLGIEPVSTRHSISGLAPQKVSRDQYFTISSHMKYSAPLKEEAELLLVAWGSWCYLEVKGNHCRSMIQRKLNTAQEPDSPCPHPKSETHGRKKGVKCNSTLLGRIGQRLNTFSLTGVWSPRLQAYVWVCLSCYRCFRQNTLDYIIAYVWVWAVITKHFRLHNLPILDCIICKH